MPDMPGARRCRLGNSGDWASPIGPADGKSLAARARLSNGDPGGTPSTGLLAPAHADAPVARPAAEATRRY